jgi:hypothetical protein
MNLESFYSLSRRFIFCFSLFSLFALAWTALFYIPKECHCVENYFCENAANYVPIAFIGYLLLAIFSSGILEGGKKK